MSMTYRMLSHFMRDSSALFSWTESDERTLILVTLMTLLQIDLSYRARPSPSI